MLRVWVLSVEEWPLRFASGFLRPTYRAYCCLEVNNGSKSLWFSSVIFRAHHKVPDEEADVAVLEEPEHLNFFRAEGVPWLKKFE